jgi:hypothetical protein
MMRLRNLLLFCVLGAACDVDAPQDDVTSQTEEGALVAPRDGEGKPGKKPGKPGPAPVTCDVRQERAKELLGTFQTCSVDADCAIEHVQAKCLNGFLCPVPVNKGGDLEALKRAATNASLQYQAACGSNCPVARCASPESSRVWCDAKEKRCKSELVRVGEDAGTPVAPVDAGASTTPPQDAGTTTTDARFSCTKDSECAVKNVGNCCGYYPRCANVNATFGPPSCKPGQAGVCGWPEIEQCRCRNNTCVALQGGREI